MGSLNKLGDMSFNELRVRGSQKISAWAERHGWSSLTILPRDDALLALKDPSGSERRPTSPLELLENFQSPTQPKFFPGLADQHATLHEFRKRWPFAEAQIVDRANQIVLGQFDLLGFSGLSFGDPLDWHFEPVSGKRTPLMHWSKLNYLDSDLAGDKKIVWELNRHQYFATLGQAYWFTGDERYAQTFVAHLESWMDRNPPKLGINWASSLEVAFRSISWLWAFYFFKDSPSLTFSTLLRALKVLYLKARHLETYLSTYFSPNTHLTGEALGLFYLGTLLPEFKEATRWRRTGLRILIEQLSRHVRRDGVYFEQSSYYHRYTTDFYTHLFILLKENSEEVPRPVAEKLTSLLDHLMYITRPDGMTPFFGDDDGGRLLPLHPSPANDFRATLSTGAALFGRPDYRFVAGGASEETLWLVGPRVLRSLDEMEEREPSKTSAAFDEGGYYVMRDGWTTNSNYLLFDCGPHGTHNCGHAHADALSFELVTSGGSSLVDPGTFTYTGSRELRDWFRGSSAHNTLTIDGESSSVPAGPFSWQSVAQCESGSWISRERFDYAAGWHDGYMRLPDPVSHTRSILFLKKDYWILRDQVRSKSAHRADVWFHFDTQANPLIEAPDSHGAYLSEGDSDRGLDIYCFGDGRWRREDASVSHCYSQRESARVYAFSAQIRGAAEIITFLLPQTAQANWRAAEVEAIGGRAFEVTHENGLDVVMIRTADHVETARLASDFEWSWARFSSREATKPNAMVLLLGTTITIAGRPALKSRCPVAFLTATQVGDQFRVETDSGNFDCQLPIADLESVLSSLKPES